MHEKLLEIVRGLLGVLANLASLTASTVDDAIVATLQAVANNEQLLALVEMLLHNDKVAHATNETEREAAILELAESSEQGKAAKAACGGVDGGEKAAGAIPWETILANLPALITLIMSFFKKPALVLVMLFAALACSSAYARPFGLFGGGGCPGGVCSAPAAPAKAKAVAPPVESSVPPVESAAPVAEEKRGPAKRVLGAPVRLARRVLNR